MAKYDLKTIEKAFNEMNLNASFTDFKALLEQDEKAIKEKEKAEKARRDATKEVMDFYPALPEGEDVDDFIRDTVPEIDDLFDCEDVEDGDADREYYVKVGDKIYQLELTCEAEWVGDWSMRCNVPGTVEVGTIKEITDYEILNESDGYMQILIK